MTRTCVRDVACASVEPLTVELQKRWEVREPALLWYGYIYYVISFLGVFTVTVSVLQLLYQSSTNYVRVVKELLPLVISFFLFLAALVLVVIYSTLELYSTFAYSDFTSFSGRASSYTSKPFMYLDNSISTYLLTVEYVNLTLVSIYTFPFIYIFIFITMLSLFFCLSYNVSEIAAFSFYVSVILTAGYVLFFTDSLILFFFSYETLLVPSFFILYNFAKTRRCVEAAYLMFFWTQFGALFLILAFLYIFFVCGASSFSAISDFYFNVFELNFIFLCLLFGFGVKLPIWPFYGWLPKAHVEASTNFSIFLSGVLVKFAFFGFLKCLLAIQLEPTFYFVYPFLIVGIVDSVFKLFYQIDLKKLVAYSTVVEMHWLTLCVVSGQSSLILSGFCMLISHALLSTNSFLLVDALARRFKTRLVTEISGINFICPKLFLISLANLLVFLGFPGSIMFISEILFFAFLFDLFPALYLLLVVLLYLVAPTFVFRTWMNVLFGASVNFNRELPTDLSSKELLVYTSLLFIMFWLGANWQAFLF